MKKIASLFCILALAGIFLPAPLSAQVSGGINTGAPDSTCQPDSGGLTYTAPGAGVVTTGLPSDAPAYYEIGEPMGAYAGTAPVGIMMSIHGGGWYVVGQGAVASERTYADNFRNRGWRTLNITYRGCADSVNDGLWFYDAIRAQVGSSMPICIQGQSAGAQIALMIAAKRPDVACVIAEGAPTDLVNIGSEGAYDPPTGGTQTIGPAKAYNWAVAAFGQDNLAANSPVNYPIAARVLVGNSSGDVFIPWQQELSLRQSMQATNPTAYIDLDQLAQGPDVKFTHKSVTTAAYNDYQVRQLNLISPIVPALPPGSATHLNEMHLTSYGNAQDGLTQLGLSSTASTATATVNGQMTLGPNFYYQVDTCVGVWPSSGTPWSKCQTSSVNTVGKKANIIYAVPTFSASWTRDAAQSFVVAYQTLSSSPKSSGTFVKIGTSIPFTGLKDAGMYY